MEICYHCGNEYKPRRRGVQKFCSNSCRSRNWQLQQEVSSQKIKKTPKKKKKKNASGNKSNEKISFPSISNAAIGFTAVDILKKIATPELQKPATKGDIINLKSFIKGNFLPIKNMQKDNFGKNPFYDVENQIVVYL